MKCPVCTNEELKMAERAGLEIDYCPKCRGVWLDRGELDQIIERSAGDRTTHFPPALGRGGHVHDDRDRHSRDDHHGEHRSGDGFKPHKKKGFLKDILDF